MPNKIPPQPNPNAPVNEGNLASSSPTPENQVNIISGIINAEENLQTISTPPVVEQAPSISGASWAAIASKSKTPQTSTKKTWASVASTGFTSKSESPALDKAPMPGPSSMKIKNWRVGTSLADKTASKQDTTKITEIVQDKKNTTEIPNASATYSPTLSSADKAKVTQIFHQLKTLISRSPNKTNTEFEKNITKLIRQIYLANITLPPEEKLTLINLILDLNLYKWTNIGFVNLFLSIGFCGVFHEDIPLDTKRKQAHLFKILTELTEEVIHDPRSYQGSGLYSYLTQVIKIISDSSYSLIDNNKRVITEFFNDFIGYINQDKGIELNHQDVYKIVTATCEMSKKNIFPQTEAAILVKNYIDNYDKTDNLLTIRKREKFSFACRHLIIKEGNDTNNKSKIASLYNNAITLIKTDKSNKSEIHDAFYLFDEINYLFNKKLIDIESCDLEALMMHLEGKVHTLISKSFLAKFHAYLYNLETTSFAKTNIYKKLKKESLDCLNENLDKITPSELAKIDEYLAKSKQSYITAEKLDPKAIKHSDAILNKICSEDSQLTRDNCLSALDIFARKIPTGHYATSFIHFKRRILPVLLSRYSQLTYNEKIKLMKVLTYVKEEKCDQKCREIISELCVFFTENTNEYMQESVSFLQAITNLGDFNSNMLPFIELSRRALIIDDRNSKATLIKSLKFYSFTYAYLSLQLKEKTESIQHQRKLNQVKDEMRDKLALAISAIESQHKDYLFNDDCLLLNYGHALLNTGIKYNVELAYSESKIQNEIYDFIANEFGLEKDKDIQLEMPLFGLPAIDIYLSKHKVAIEVDGHQHYKGAENKAVKGLSIMQKAILQMNGIHLINIPLLDREKEDIFQDIKQQLHAFLHQQPSLRFENK